MLETLKFSYKESENQKELFSPRHTRFDVTLTNLGRDYTFDYQCNTHYNLPCLNDVIECLLNDSYMYSYYPTLEEFMIEYEDLFDNNKKLLQAFESCKLTHDKMHRLFSTNEMEYMQEQIDKVEDIIKGL